ncbi:PolC-type DNA polymerase III [Lacicoccus qingdaonensis]|uniref:DNA polymerase III PolC-type n=1 Tax=Lacicoccus qingdaonensis TaxID=576118 RepID=A0A1G9AA40_9BACL|nr:PolC-type DNA polymerase III [Salinicoccus qingdaonensis]SDK24219.1 DNA polymerase III catalytic subunit, PolC type [Salinicoccus qingdaonensis]
MQGHEQFKILLSQAKIEMNEHLASGVLNKVIVDDDERLFQFHIHFDKVIPASLRQLLISSIKNAFSEIADIEVKLYSEHFSDDNVIDYLEDILLYLNINDNVRFQLLNCKKEYRDGVLIFNVQNEITRAHFNKHVNGNLKAAYHDFGMPVGDIEFIVDANLDEEKRNNLENRLQEERTELVQNFISQQEEIKEQQNNMEDHVEKQIGKHVTFDGARPLSNIFDEEYNVKVEGVIFDKDVKVLRTGRQILNIKITDYSDSISAKMFSRNNKNDEAVFGALSENDWVVIEGHVEYDDFVKDLVLNIKNLTAVKKPPKRDDMEEKRVELHLHSAMSQMDGLNNVGEFVKRAGDYGHKAIAITDHNNVQAFPDAYYASEDTGVKVIYGMEGLLVDDGAKIAYKPQDIDLESHEFVVFDVETTGLSSKYDKIIELAGVKVKGGEIIDRYEAFSNPNEPLTETIKEITGITDDMLTDAPPISEVITEFKEWVGDAIFVAHNASFDMGFIEAAYQKENLGSYENGVIDTLELSRTVNTDFKKHGLNILAKKYNVELTQHHRAIYDAEATAYIFIKMLYQLKQLNVVNHKDINDRLMTQDAYKRSMPSHVTLLVKTQKGLKNLFKIVSYSLTDNFYKMPRIRKDVLEKYREGILVGSACDQGEVFTAMMQKPYEEAKDIAEFYDYLEVFPKALYRRLLDREIVRSEETLEEIITNIIKVGEELGKPVAATGNVHYLDESDKLCREILVKSNPGNPLSRGILPEAHFRSTAEMYEDFSFLDEETRRKIVIDTPNEIADSIDVVKPIKDDLFTPNIDGANDEIRDMSYNNARKLYGEDLPEIVVERIEKELDSIIGNGFSVIYLISQKLVKQSLDDGYLVGSRGSVGSSFVATMTEITEVNPLPPHYICPDCKETTFFTDGSVSSGYDLTDKACDKCGAPLIKEGQDIPFETFLGFKGDKVPDIDLNFSGDYQPKAHNYTKELFGEDYVFRAGTIGTVAEKTAYGYVKGYMNDHGITKRGAEIDRLVKGCSGVKRTTGQHPGGIIVVPDDMDIFDFTPIQFPADDIEAEWKTTHFDFHSIDNNLLKLDILGHDDPTMIRMLQDLSGIDPTTLPTDDEETMELFSSPETLGVTEDEIVCKTGTLGVPEFGTGFVRQMLEDTKPSTFSELVQISGLSHGTDVWLGNAQDLIRSGTCDLSNVIGCRDDIMVTLMYKGLEPSLAFNIMEKVRKGKGLTEEHEAAMRDNGVENWYIESCKKIKYMFPKAHAAAYVLMAVRIAYFKVHYPLYYYASYFTVRASDFDLLTMVKDKTTIRHRIKEMNNNFHELSKKEKDTLVVLEIANEMAHRGFKMHPVDIEKSEAFEFKITEDGLIPPFIAVPGLGANVAKRVVETREEEPFISKEDLNKRGGVAQKVVEYMTELGTLEHLPDKAQLSIFDI